MVIKRMLGSAKLAEELARSRHNLPAQAVAADSSYLMFGPSIWDGVEENLFQAALVRVYPGKRVH